MILLHASDIHDSLLRFEPFRELRETAYDVLVITGDWAPECFGGRREIGPFQMDFWRAEAKRLRDALGDKAIVAGLGNHDLLSEAWVEKTLREAGLNVIFPRKERGKAEVTATIDGVRFVGMRELPYICGAFEGELERGALDEWTRERAMAWRRTDVLLAHCPPPGDAVCPTWDWGNPALRDVIGGAEGPRLVLSGHLHENGGRAEVINGALVCNSARTARLVELSPTRGAHGAKAAPDAAFGADEGA